MESTAFLSPNPATINEVQPVTPIIVIKNLFLYLKTFLAVTFCVKFKCFQINGIFSKNTLLPGFGAFGLIKFAGVDANVFAQE